MYERSQGEMLNLVCPRTRNVKIQSSRTVTMHARSDATNFQPPTDFRQPSLAMFAHDRRFTSLSRTVERAENSHAVPGGYGTFPPGHIPQTSSPVDVSPPISASIWHFPLLSVCRCELPTTWNKRAEPPSFFSCLFCHSHVKHFNNFLNYIEGKRL